jgi:hypothetical protein
MLRTTLALCLFAIASIEAQDVSSVDLQKQPISTSVDTSILRALIKFGSETRIPIGIALDTVKPEKLCEEHRQFTLQSRPMSEFLNRLLAQSSYVWSFDQGVLVVQSAHLPDRVSQVLEMKFDRFGGVQTTMQGLGTILSGWIYSRLHPEGSGFAGDILSSPDAEQFPKFEVRDASVEQILNQIVLLGSKGIWLLRLRPDFERSKEVDLHAYSYKDDASILPTTGCSSL